MKNKFKISYSDLWGLREEKYKFLENHNIKNTDWRKLDFKEPNYFFVPKDTKSEKIYNHFVSISEIFNKFSNGVKTHRDEFILDDSKDVLEKRLSIFIDKDQSDEMIRSMFRLKDTGTWKISDARKKVIEKGIKDSLFRKYLYRLFEEKWIYFDRDLVERARDNFIWDLDFDNLALVTTRQLATEQFKHIFITGMTPDVCLISLQTKETSYIFPLYLYQKSNQINIFESKKGKVSNIKNEILAKLKMEYHRDITYEEIFYYIYAILYSNIYRQKYNEFLKIDFPKIPFTKSYKLFKQLSQIGKNLINLHLLKKVLENDNVKFPISGESTVERKEYKNKRIHINDKQYFENVEQEVWNYYIGGYQVLDKWLKDKIGKILTREDINHYLKIISAIKETIKIQKEIDKLYPKVEKSLIK